MISIKDMNKAAVLCALHRGTRTQGMAALHDHTPTIAEAEQAIARGYVDYFAGRPIKADFSGDTLDPFLYNRDAGQGTAERIIDGLRTGATASAR